MARSLLADANLGNEFRGYAVLATAHIINRMPSRAHEGKSPVEIRGEIKPSIGHLRVFGCPAHVLVPAETRRKIDPKSVRCLFIGYAEDPGTQVYKLYHKETRKTIVSRDVVFDESRVVGRGEKLEITAGNGLAETPLNQSVP